MEKRATYGANSDIRSGCLTAARNWESPSGNEIRAGLSMAGWTAVEFAKRIKTSDRTVRRWIAEEKIIPYAAWCILCAEANLGEIWK